MTRGANAIGAAAWGSLDEGVPGLPPSYRLADDLGPLFLAVELDLFQPGSAAATPLGEPRGALPRGALTALPTVQQDQSTFRASDLGWVTRATDPPGLQPYPPILASGVEIDRALELPPDGAGAGAGWGSLRIVNAAGALNAIAGTRNVDGRGVRVRMGRKQLLPHGVWRDPAWGETADLLNLIGAGLAVEEREMRVALRDATYWLERQVDGAVYAGSGGIEGTAALAGKRKPRLRGGEAGNPVREIAPELISATAGIYQVSDSPGTIVTLYERGLSGGITFAGNVADILAASPAAGTYVVESTARGLFIRLGTFPPAGVITVDATGAFPDATTPITAAAVALQVLRQDLAVPDAYLDAGSFTGVSAAAPWTAGVHIPAGEALDGVAVVGLLMRSCAARLVPARTGRLAAVQLTAPDAGTVPVGTLTTAQILDCRRVDLPAPMAPPPWRVRVGWGRNFTIQTTALAPTLSAARIQELAEPFRVATASNAAVQTAWRRPSDPPVVETLLTSAAGGDALAAVWRDLWCVTAGRTLWDVTIPLAFALRFDLGQPIVVAYPGPLAAGALGRIVGERLRTADNLATIQVLI